MSGNKKDALTPRAHSTQQAVRRAPGGVGLADVVDGNAVRPRVLARPGSEIPDVLHDLLPLQRRHARTA